MVPPHSLSRAYPCSLRPLLVCALARESARHPKSSRVPLAGTSLTRAASTCQPILTHPQCQNDKNPPHLAVFAFLVTSVRAGGELHTNPGKKTTARCNGSSRQAGTISRTRRMPPTSTCATRGRTWATNGLAAMCPRIAARIKIALLGICSTRSAWCGWPRYFVRVAYDPRANFTSESIWCFNAATRF